MHWNKILSIDDFDAVIDSSYQQPQVIFKHSTRCGISMLALHRLNSELANVNYHLLDLIAHRDISNYIAHHFQVQHQSPQILLIVKGKCIFDTSHMEISEENIERNLEGHV